MKFLRMAKFWKIPNFGTKDVSFGIHWCWQGRLDIHFWHGMLSIGRVPLYQMNDGRIIAVSNSYHSDKTKPIRAGTII